VALSFAIPAYNEEANIGKCIESILRELAREKIAADIVIANNASTDRTKEIAARYPGVRVVDEPTRGIVWARRAAFLGTRGDIVANIDADTTLPRGWARTVLREFEKNKKLAALSGPFVYRDLSLTTQFFVKIFYSLGFLFYILNRFVLRAGSMLQGGNFVLRRSALEAIGGFDTSIDFYGEDADLARRLEKAGGVKFTFRLPIHASGRRLSQEGVMRMGIRYALNYFWVIYFGKPFTKTSTHVREKPD